MRKMTLAVVVATAMLVFPIATSGQTPGVVGGSPNAVVMNTPDTGGDCPLDPVKTDPVGLVPTSVSVATGPSHVLVFFSSTWNGFDRETELVLRLEIQGEHFSGQSPEWILPDTAGGQFNANHNGGTVMWSFANVPAGEYTVQATGALAGFNGAVRGSDSVTFQGCSLAAFVMPAT